MLLDNEFQIGKKPYLTTYQGREHPILKKYKILWGWGQNPEISIILGS